MVQKTIQCCSNKPNFLVTYSVSGSEKEYLVCSVCVKLECFSKYITSKTLISNSIYRKKIESEFFDEIVENEIIDVKFDELIEQNENITEQNEEEHSQFSSKNKRSTKL